MYLMLYLSDMVQINSVQYLHVIFFLQKKNSYYISLPKYIRKPARFFFFLNLYPYVIDAHLLCFGSIKSEELALLSPHKHVFHEGLTAHCNT